MKYLKQKGSGHIYVWSEALSQRDDMEPCEFPAPQTPAQNQEEPKPESSGLEAALENFRRDVSRRKPKAGEA